jgi:hypothetical protein
MIVNKKAAAICYGVTALIFAALILWGQNIDFGGATEYSVITFWIVIPLTCLITGVVLGVKNAAFKWFYPPVFGVITVITITLPFNQGHFFRYMLQTAPVSILYAFVPALIGVLIGTGVSVLLDRRKVRN